MSSLMRKVVVNSASNIAVPLTSFFSAPILAHGLGVIGRGEVAGATAPLFLLAIAGSLGLPEAVTYFAARSRLNLSSFLGTALFLTAISGIVFTVGICFLSEVLASGDGDFKRMMILAAFALVPTLLISVIRAAAIGVQDFRLVFWERVVANVGRLLVLLALWACGALTPLSAVCILSFVPLVGALMYIPLFVSQRLAFRRLDTEVIKYGCRIWIGSLSGIMLSRIDQVLMVPLSSSAELGLYAVAVSISEVPLVLNASLREVLFAVDSVEPNRERMAQVGRLSSLVTTTICAAFAVLCPIGIPLLFGQEFSESLEVCLIMLLAVVIGNPGSIAGTALTSLGRPGLRSIALTAACVVNITIVILVVPAFGAVGAAWATLVANIVSSTLAILFCRFFGGYGLFDFYGLRTRDLRAIRGVRFPRSGGI
jgi:O-antigen/teichoic acid export membrane protein